MFATGSLADEDEKDAFATNARLLCIANAATACVMALESWMKMAVQLLSRIMRIPGSVGQ